MREGEQGRVPCAGVICMKSFQFRRAGDRRRASKKAPIFRNQEFIFEDTLRSLFGQFQYISRRRGPCEIDQRHQRTDQIKLFPFLLIPDGRD